METTGYREACRSTCSGNIVARKRHPRLCRADQHWTAIVFRHVGRLAWQFTRAPDGRLSRQCSKAGLFTGEGDRRASPPEQRQMGLCLAAACMTQLVHPIVVTNMMTE